MSKSKLALFLAYCPDRTGPGVLAKRLSVRAQHFREYQQTLAEGHAEFGRGILPQPTAPLPAADLALLPAGVEPMAGSVLLLRYPTLDAAWERVRADVYWTAGVWDPERTVVEQFCEPPPQGSVPGVDTRGMQGTNVK